MSADSIGGEESNGNPEGRDGAGARASAIADLPSNATQPGGPRQGTDEQGSKQQGTGSRDAKAPKPSDRLPAAGPHADPALMNPDATPGTGALTPPGEHDDTDSTSS
jgi:hypothetical protein